MLEEKKELQDSLKRITEIVTEVRENSAHKDDVVKKEEFEKVIKSYQDAGEEIQKQTQEIAGIKASIQLLNNSEENSSDKEVLEVKEAFDLYCKKRDATALEELEKKSSVMGAYSGEAGGYTVPKVVSAKIIQRIFETSPIRSVASVENISSDAVEFILDDEEASFGLVSELGSRSDTDSPDLAVRKIAVHEFYAQPVISNRLLQDSQFNLEGWIANKVSKKLERAENTYFVTGNGVDRPRGFTTYAAGTYSSSNNFYDRTGIQQVNMGSSSTFTGAGLLELQGALKADYRSGAVWLMGRDTHTELLKLMYTDNKFHPLRASGVNNEELTLLGKRVVIAEDMPALSSGNLAVAYGNFSEGYQIVDRVGISLIRDNVTAKGRVKFFFTKRTGGDVLNTEAIKLGKVAT